MLRWSCQFVFKSLRVLSTNHCLLRWNHYKSLGLPPCASMAEIKAAYYKLSKLYHPDRNNGSEASARKFRDIVAAYEVLGKPSSRKAYDREIARKYMARSSDLKSKKKGKKKSSNSPKSKPHFKSEIRSKSKHKSGVSGKKGMSKDEQDFEKLIVRAIPLVVACLMGAKK